MSASTHTHAHTDTHPHAHPGHIHEAGTPPEGGPVVVDIGDGVGALIVHADPSLLGLELHVRKAGEGHTTHTGVWERQLGDRQIVVAVFLALDEGCYTLLDLDGQPTTEVVVESGRVAELHL